MTTQGPQEEPPSDAPGAASGEEGSTEVFSSDEGPAVGGVAHAYRGEGVPPPPTAARGRYRFDAPPLNHPPDPILPFIAPPVPRRRRSDWPVLVIALIIAALVMAGCCIAGFALYTTKAPLFQ
jgi:hypothetical protein